MRLEYILQVALFLAGLFAMPIALPGSALAKALAARERLLDALEPIVKERHDSFHAEVRQYYGRVGAQMRCVLR
jgi:hypothetical protein